MSVRARGASYLQRWLIRLLFFFAAATPVRADCPRACVCNVPSEMHCTFRYLAAIPDPIQPHVERINFGYNSIPALRENDLLGLEKLELLMLHSNMIVDIEDNTFQDLRSLQVLKMSFNKIKKINKGTFKGLESLMRLYLDHNHIEFINPEAFYGLTNLQLVHLEGNHLQQLHPDTFITMRLNQVFKVSSVRTLHLSDNQLETLPADVFSGCSKLENLFLHGNPWACDCRMSWFAGWAQKNTGLFKCKRDKRYPNGLLCPVCQNPVPYSNRNLFLLPVDAFTCSKPWIHPHLKQKNITVDEGDFTPVSPRDFIAPLGTIQMNLSNQFQSDASLSCSVQRPSAFENLNQTLEEEEENNVILLTADITSYLVCNVEHEHIQRLWQILATYSDAPMRLERGSLLTRTPEMVYQYSEIKTEEGMHTNVEAEIKASPAWLMQGVVSFQLDRTSTTYATLHIRYQSLVTLRVETASPKRGHYSWTMIKRNNQTKTEHTVVRGGVANLNCQIQGEPKPLLEWILPDGSKVRAPYSSEDRRIVIYAEGKLTLRSADASDTGMYRCIATNYLDADILVFQLIVLSPDVEEDEVNGVHLSRPLGGNQVLDCSSSGSPKVSIQWILPDHSVLDVSHGTKTLYENGTLEIQGLTERDRGFYRCIAANNLGVDLLVSQLTLTEEKTGPDSEGSGMTDVSSIENTMILDETSSSSPYSRSGPGSQKIPSDPPEPSHRSQGRGGAGRTWGQRSGLLINRRPWSRRLFDKASRTIEQQKFAEFLKKAQKGSGVKYGKISNMDDDNERGSAVDLNEDQFIIVPDSPLGVTVSAKKQQTITTTTEAENKNTPTTQMYTQPDSRPVKSVYRNLAESDELDSSQETQIRFTAQPAELETSTWGAVSVTTDPYVTPMSDSAGPRDIVVHTATDPERQTLLATITTTESQQDEITFHTTQRLKSPHLLAGSTIISKQQIHIIPDKNNRSGGHRRIFHSRRRIIKPSRINDVQSFLNQLKQSSNKKSTGTTRAPTINTTENPVRKTTLSYQSSAITSISVSKIIRGKIPWNRLFGNKSREKILGKLKKPFISQKHTTTITAETKTPSIITMPADVFTTASVPFNSMDEKDILSPLRNTGRKDSSSGDDYEGLSSSDSVSTTLRPGINQVTTATPPYQRSFTTVENSPGLQIFPFPPTVRTPSAENEVISSGSGGTPNISGTIRQRPVWKGQKRTFFRGRRPLIRPAAGLHPSKTTKPLATGIKMETTVPQHGRYSHYKPSNKPTNVNLYDETYWTNSNSKLVYTTTKRPLIPSTTLNPSTTVRPTTSWTNTKPPTWSKKIQTGRPQVKGIKPTVKSSTSQESKERPPNLGTMTVLTLEQKYTSTPATYNIINAYTSFYDANGIDMTSSSIQVPEVTTRLMMNRPKIIGGTAASYTVLSHSNAYLPCEAVGTPQPTINWRRLSSSTGSTIIIKGKMGKYEVLRNGTLSIHNTNIKDRGQYLCTAENDHGMDKLLVTLSVVAYPSRILEPKIRQIKVLTGNTIEVTCKAEGRPTPLISWILPNRTQVRGSNTERGRVSVTAEGALVIKDVSMNDRGNYKCIASNQAGGDIATVQLHVVAAPPGIMEEKRQQVNIRVSQNLLLPCTGRGSPQPTIHWVLHDGSHLHSKRLIGDTRILVHENGTLHIRDVTQADSGKYECIATSSTGLERRVVTLVVEKAVSAPHIVEISQRKMELFFGDQLRLNCSATGDPKPKIMWRLPSKAVVDQGHRMGSRIQVIENGTLLVNSMTDKEAGHYLCVARNKIGDDIKLIRVSVSMKPAKIEPKLYEKKEVTYGNDVKVDCKASGAPKPEISWGLPDGTLVSSALQADVSSGGGRARRYTLFDNGTLYLNQVSISEEGDYICYAENHLGKDEMTVHISVMTVTPVIHPPSQTYARVKPGGSIRFDCEAAGEPKPKIFWMLPTNDVITASNERYLVHGNGSLDIRDIRVSDTGEYVCMVRNPAGENRKVYKLDIDGNPPVINGHRQNRTVIKDVATKFSRKLIDCKAEGNPTPSVTWIMPDNIFLIAPYSGSRINVHHNGTLEIRNVRLTDTAEFICLARNDGGEAVLVVQLEVTGLLQRPIFKNPFNERIVSQIGKTIILNCSADGHPSPEIVWTFPNGTRFSNYADRGSHFHIRKDGSLVIRPGKEDAGNYRCGARNYMGYIEKLIILEVGQKPYILTRPRGIIRSVSGEPLLLHCLSDGSPTPKIYWTIPGGHTLSHPQILGRHQLLENGTLVVEDTTLHDQGNYICRARNNAGEAVIIVPVVIVAYPPRITIAPLPNVKAARGTPLQLSCAGIGIPKPEITWELPDRSVLSSTPQGRPMGGELLHPQGTLIIQRPSISDTGRYKCLAKNYLGIDSKVTYVRVL